MDTFTAKAASASAKTLSPSKHVNYTQGMILGADDFMQEFAFHNGRNEWLLRDLVGYGTVSGLRVSYDAARHVVQVEGGTAVSPRGQLIRVCSDQCADLAVWLQQKENQDEATSRVGSPLSASITLFVTLAFRECPTDNVPIAGEPCRSEEDAMAPSRLTDDFVLKLSFDRPEQPEEEVLRLMVDWLRQIPIVAGAGSPLEQILGAIRHASKDVLASPPESPPQSPADVFSGSPPGTLSIPAAAACEYWRAIFRLWVTELRPAWQARFPNLCQCSACDSKPNEPASEERLLLAELHVPLTFNSNWQIAGNVAVIENARPFLLHLRLLEELAFCAQGATVSALSAAVTHPSGTGGYSIVAAGILKGDGTRRLPVYNNLRSFAPSPEAGKIKVTFNNYVQPQATDTFQYIVKVTSMYDDTQNNSLNKAVSVVLDRFDPDAFFLRVTDGSGSPIAQTLINGLQFMIEVSRYQ